MATVQEVTRGCRYAACRGGVLSCMCRPNSHAATSKRRYESSAGENDCAASRRKLDRDVNQLLVHSGSYLRARWPSSEHSHPFTPSWEVCFFFWLLFCFFLNTVSIIMLRVASRGMIILSYYRLPDAAHTFPLPLLEGEKAQFLFFWNNLEGKNNRPKVKPMTAAWQEIKRVFCKSH